MGQMLSYLHFTPGDVLWFEGWVPGKGSTLFAACIGLFLLGMAERWIAALRAGTELALVRDVKVIQRKKELGKRENPPSLMDVLLLRGDTAAPFLFDHAWARFILQGVQATLAILIMLTIMTFQLSFIFSLAIGVGVGEIMYGRFTDAVDAQLDLVLTSKQAT
ncbi:hypothetical protein H0H93_007605 [Arthromyces matolae]|nr:hypothetical protein H0H93_007605 [Arthromyces matolae]